MQPAAYGFDLCFGLDAATQLGDSGCGMALFHLDVSDAKQQRVKDGGICGVRYMMTNRVLGWGSLEPRAARLVAMDWMVSL